MDPKHLYYLSVILDKGSMTEAAHFLAVTQPTLTRVVATLEMQAGTKILHRSRHGVKATPLGEALAREGRAIQTSVESAMQFASKHRIGLDQEIRIGVGPLLACTIFPKVLNQLIAQFAQCSLAVETAKPNALYNGLLENRYDIVIAPAATTKDPQGITRELVSEDELGVFCSVNHPYSELAELNATHLRQAYWLSLGHASPFERSIMEMFNLSGVYRIRTQVVFGNDAVLLLNLLQQGKHLSVLPRMPLRHYQSSSPLVELPLSSTVSQARNIHLFAKENQIDTPLYLALREQLRQAVL